MKFQDSISRGRHPPSLRNQSLGRHNPQNFRLSWQRAGQPGLFLSCVSIVVAPSGPIQIIRLLMCSNVRISENNFLAVIYRWTLAWIQRQHPLLFEISRPIFISLPGASVFSDEALSTCLSFMLRRENPTRVLLSNQIDSSSPHLSSLFSSLSLYGYVSCGMRKRKFRRHLTYIFYLRFLKITLPAHFSVT